MITRSLNWMDPFAMEYALFPRKSPFISAPARINVRATSAGITISVAPVSKTKGSGDSTAQDDTGVKRSARGILAGDQARPLRDVSRVPLWHPRTDQGRR